MGPRLRVAPAVKPAEAMFGSPDLLALIDDLLDTAVQRERRRYRCTQISG